MTTAELRWDEGGLIPAVVQDVATRQVLMVAHMNQTALAKTLEGQHVWFWSRSRQELWEKGATSGNFLVPKSVTADCDGDTLLILAEPTGPICHTGATSCFFNQLTEGQAAPGPEVIAELAAVIAQRNAERPPGSYTAELLTAGIDRIGKKIGEEAAELIIAAKNGEPAEIVWEAADLWYHTLVLLEASGVPLESLQAELAKRRK